MKRRRASFFSISALVVTLLFVGCGGSTHQFADDEACDAWGAAFCDAVESAGDDLGIPCGEFVAMVRCKADAPLDYCDGHVVPEPGQYLSDCLPREIADVEWSVAQCDEYLTEVCSANVRCGVDKSTEECTARYRSDFLFLCEETIGVSDSLDGCLAALPSWDCSGPHPTECPEPLFLFLPE